MRLTTADANSLAGILAVQAANAPAGPVRYFKDLVMRSNLPPRWQQALAGSWTGDTNIDAGALIRYLNVRDTNPADPNFTALGSLVSEFFQDVGLEEARSLAALVVAYSLYLDPAALERLVARYQVPLKAPVPAAPPASTGPWLGPQPGAVQLQSWLAPEPDYLDVGFLRRGMERAAAVCRVEVLGGARLGTGFLIAPKLLLTNYHVLYGGPGEDLQQNAAAAVLRFGNVSAPPGQEAAGRVFHTHPAQPVLAASETARLDYVLLQVEDAIKGVEGIAPAPCEPAAPAEKSALNILQHPGGAAMKLALSGNGVSAVCGAFVQYVTRAAGGSSGSPCFNDDWKVVAIHHAERAKAFGAVREGILLGAIYPEIQPHLVG